MTSDVSTALLGKTLKYETWNTKLMTIIPGAVQASISVLLTIGFGVVSAQYNLLSQDSASHVSTVCVKLFLPALLLTNIGSQLNPATGSKYVPIVIWSLLYNAVSIVVGIVLRKIFHLPRWTTPAITFNNSISMPLLLMEALGHTSILNPMLEASGDNLTDALARSKSFFLVNSMVGAEREAIVEWLFKGLNTASTSFGASTDPSKKLSFADDLCTGCRLSYIRPGPKTPRH